jgi:hypothetical protein
MRGVSQDDGMQTKNIAWKYWLKEDWTYPYDVTALEANHEQGIFWYTLQPCWCSALNAHPGKSGVFAKYSFAFFLWGKRTSSENELNCGSFRFQLMIWQYILCQHSMKMTSCKAYNIIWSYFGSDDMHKYHITWRTWLTDGRFSPILKVQKRKA